MIPLAPAPKVIVTNGWELVATEAGRGMQGLTATVQVYNGTLQECQNLLLTDPDKRVAFAVGVAHLVGITPEAVLSQLLELTAGIEGVLREAERQPEKRRTTQAKRLVELITQAEVELFHHDYSCYATIPVDGHKETWPLHTRDFRHWMERLFYIAEGKPPSTQAVQEALGVLMGKAQFEGPELPVYIRLAEDGGKLYLDLTDSLWRVVEITPTSWSVRTDSPVKFRRVRGMLPIPVPERGGNLSDLRKFVNIASERDWILLTAWLVAAFRPRGPYPILVLHGEQGSAKSTVTEVLRKILDPHKAALRSEPRDVRELMIAAGNNWVMAFDNLSHLTPWLSDALCRLATGSGFATRELYSNTEETIITAQRPIILNGIEELATRSDLLDRSIILYLPSIDETARQDEEHFWYDFQAETPFLLGALLNVISAALRTLPTVRLPHLPRMADFARWSCAAAHACGWSPGDFLTAYTGNRSTVHELVLEASPVTSVLRDFIQAGFQPWMGTASELLIVLAEQAGEAQTQKNTWPKNPRVLSNMLRRLAPNLRAVGVDVTFDRQAGGNRQRMITLRSISLSTSTNDSPSI